MIFRPRPLTHEFKLLVECCRWSFAPGDATPVQQLAVTADWDRLLALSRRHRVQGLSWHCLRQLDIALPADVAASFTQDAESVAQHNLRAARLSGRLLDAFSRAGIPLIFVKGLTLSKLAYGDPFLKMGWDVDVLIPTGAIAIASAQLQALGFRLITPAVDPASAALLRWHGRRKESVWRSPDGLHLELHTRLADSVELIPSVGIGSARQDVAIAAGLSLPTLITDDLIAYLCVHGASSAWFRLKWITDLAALLHGRNPDDIERLLGHARKLGAGRSVNQGLILASRVYGTPASAALAGLLQNDAANRRLARAAWDQMMREAEPTQTRFGTVPIHFTQLLLQPGLAYKAREAVRQLRDWASPVG